MNDPQQFGLSELGQRMQAMSDPAPEPRLRPYQGSSTSAANGRPLSPAEVTPSQPVSPVDPISARPATNPFQPYGTVPTSAQPAQPEPFQTTAATSTNGHSGPVGPVSPADPLAAHAASPLSTPLDDPNSPKSGLQRAVSAIRSALPLVQRLLPLLEGNFANVLGALVAPQPGAQHPPQQVKVDLEPVERGLAEVRTSNRELKTQIQEQGTSLKRVEDQLERVREATDRNTLEQQELVEDLRAVGTRISTMAIVGLVLLLVSLGLNVYFLVQLQHILR